MGKSPCECKDLFRNRRFRKVSCLIMITDEIKEFTEKKVERLIRMGGYRPYAFKWSHDWCGVHIPNWEGHCSVFHGVYRDVERSVKKRFNVKINLYTKRSGMDRNPQLKSNSGMGMRSFAGSDH